MVLHRTRQLDGHYFVVTKSELSAAERFGKRGRQKKHPEKTQGAWMILSDVSAASRLPEASPYPGASSPRATASVAAFAVAEEEALAFVPQEEGVAQLLSCRHQHKMGARSFAVFAEDGSRKCMRTWVARSAA
jgi:hypothetical protein